MGSSWVYPWYEASTDGVRRVQVVPPPTQDTWFQRLIAWLFENGWTVATWSAVVVGLLAIVYLLWRAYAARLRLWGRGEETEQLSAAGRANQILNLPFEVEPAAADDLVGRARRSYENGDFGRAIIYLYSHQLVELDKHRLITLTKGKTNRQYLRELRQRPKLGELLEGTMRPFEDHFFGARRLDRSALDACWARLDEFDTLVRREAAA